MDREKLMFALEMCSTGICSPKECPYNKDDYDSTTNCDDDQMRDALALLKEQESVIEQYHKADGFLDAHGWKWEGR